MIVPFSDRPVPVNEELRLPVNVDPRAGAVRFADLVAARPDIDAPIAPADPHTPPAAGAEIFNQEGFFGDPVDAPAGVEVSQGVTRVVRPPVVEARAADLAGEPVVRFAGQVRTSHEAPATLRAPVPTMPSRGANNAAPVLRRTPHALIGEFRGEQVRSRTRPSPHPAPPPRRLPAPSAGIAVAVHALAQGVEIAARVEQLDPEERARLADEIAALLSSHGYVPARITVTAVSPSAHQELR